MLDIIFAFVIGILAIIEALILLKGTLDLREKKRQKIRKKKL